MQSYQVLEVLLSQDAPVQRDATVDQLAEFASEFTSEDPVLLLCVNDDINELINMPDLEIVDLGEKKDAMQLSRYFKESGSIQALKTSYTAPGRTLASARSFLKKSCARGGVYLLGIPKETFARLKDQNAVADVRKPSVDVAKIKADYINNQKKLLAVGPELEIPQALSDTFIGVSEDASIIRGLIMCVARTNIPVLVEGESGTGKEIVAWQIHDNSKRREKRFVVVNCGAIPEYLFESELFGHVKGAFTNATEKKDGFWTLADEGTLFLDEIADLPLAQQVKVLRALDGSEYYPVGSKTSVKSSARIIAATNRNVKEMVKQGTFREDLYYRLRYFTIRTFALRDHPEDIPLIADCFWKKICPDPKSSLPDDVLNELKKLNWPGNARDLRSFLENTYAFVDNNPVTVEVIQNVFKDRLGPLLSMLGVQTC